MHAAHWLLVLWMALATFGVGRAARRLRTELADLMDLRRTLLADPGAAIARHCADAWRSGPAPPGGGPAGAGPAGGAAAPVSPALPQVGCRRDLLWRHTLGPPVSVCDGGPPPPGATAQLRRYTLSLACDVSWGGRRLRLPVAGTSLVR